MLSVLFVVISIFSTGTLQVLRTKYMLHTADVFLC